MKMHALRIVVLLGTVASAATTWALGCGADTAAPTCGETTEPDAGQGPAADGGGVFDPVWVPVKPMLAARARPAAATIVEADGQVRVLVVGAPADDGPAAEIYDPDA